MTDDVAQSASETEQECPKCGGAGKRAVHGGMFGFQECTRCDGTGEVEPQ